MFIGHFAMGFAAKRLDRSPSLATYFLAAQLPDLLWPFLLLAGAEHVTVSPGDTAFTPLRFDAYPYSHSLLTVVGWGGLAGLLYASLRGSARGAAIVATLVVSHWVLDVASHRPDMPVFPGWGPKLGLGLWRSIPATLAVELAIFVVSLVLYARATRAIDGKGRWGLAALVVVLVAIYLAAAFGPPPPSVTAIAISGMLGAPMLALLAWWVDLHRRPAER